MDPIRRRLSLGLGGALATGLPALAQEAYPNRPIRIIVPLAAGGGGDLTARQVAAQLSTRLGVPVVVENRPGAGGSLGTDIALKSAPDGYTLIMISSSYTCNAAIHRLPFDPIADIEPIALFKRESLILVGNPKGPGDLRSLIEAARRAPGSITYGSSGIGGISHLSTENFANLAGIKLNHVAYKGTGPALQDVMAGNVQLLFSSIAPVVPLVKSERVLGLAIADRRSEAVPSVPSFTEAGVPEFKSGLWHAVAGPKGMPAAVVARLNAELNAILGSAQMTERIQSEGSQAAGGSPQVLMDTIRADIDLWKDVVARAGIKAE